MSQRHPLWQWSAAGLAQAIRNKEISSSDAVQAHLDRIEAVNPRLNAVTRVLAEEALRAAGKADRRIAAGETVGPLHGVPITLKENLDLVGTPTTMGIVGLKDKLPRSDAAVVTHLKRAGAIPIGRTNLPDYGLRWHTVNDLHGATLNPWDSARTPGGSSGGEAAAIASGMSPLGVGNDMGGSLRFPAQCCGIAALRPSLGRVSRTLTSIFADPPLLYEQLAGVNGPMARHVEDLRLALTVMSQPDPGDPWWTPAPLSGPPKPGPLRVAVTTNPGGAEGDPEVASGVRRAAEDLAEAGYLPEEVDPPSLDRSTRTLEQISDWEFKSYLEDMEAMVSEEAKRYLGLLLAEADPDPASYMAAIGTRHEIAQEWSLFMARYPLVLGPVSTLQPFEVGYDLAGVPELRRFVASMRLTEVCNLLGLPSVVVPVGVADGLPLGVQLIAPRLREDLCLDAAEAIEQRQGVITPIEPRATAAR